MSVPQVPPLPSGGTSFLWNYLAAHQGRKWDAWPDRSVLEFLGHCLARAGRSQAQLYQDCYVAWKLRDKRDGYFVEFGATDGVALSNTFFLERELGWTGILAEPFPRWHAALAANRAAARIDYRCVWRASGEQLEFLALDDAPELATLKTFAAEDHHAAQRARRGRSIVVATVSLTDLLVQHGAPRSIDYLSVDVEGAELEVLRGLDFERYEPRILTVEHNFHEQRRRDIHTLLGSHGFVREFEAFSGFDDWYYHPGRCPE